MKISHSALPLMLLLGACGGENAGAAAEAAEETTVSDSAAAEPERGHTLTRQGVPGSIEGREAVEVTPDQLKPAFTKETVLKLNAITRKAQANSAEYIDNVKRIRALVDAGAEEGADQTKRAKAEAAIEELRVLRDRAAEINAEMKVAVQEVKDSGQHYSDALLYGIESYPDDVEKSISLEIEKLTARLNAE